MTSIDPNSLKQSSATLIGWGSLKNGTITTKLKKSHVTIFSQEYCNQTRGDGPGRLPHLFQDNLLCAGKGILLTLNSK